MNLTGPFIVSPGTEVKITVSGTTGTIDGYAVVNGQRSPLRITRLPHGLVSIVVLIPSNAKGHVLIRLSDDHAQFSHTILLV